jgi:hypothetical protein
MIALGGTAKVARLTRRTPKAASNWQRFDAFPSNTFLVLRAALRRQRLTAPIKLWNMVDPIITHCGKRALKTSRRA